jgi:polysaccharide pyruvyl transferase WcaK-like protein
MDLRPRLLIGANANLAADDRDFGRALLRATGDSVEVLHACSEVGWLSSIASARMVVSGRFHYSIAAAWLGTPFVALDSNTPKMRGLRQALWSRPGMDHAAGLREPLSTLIAEAESTRIDDSARARLRAAAGRNFS